MKILKIKIYEFGGLFDRTYNFSSGFNLVSGDNESGKSTILQFIKFIFYGIPKKNSENIQERQRSFSWSNGIASGSLTICTKENKIFSIMRKCIWHNSKNESYTEEIQIIDEKSGSEINDIKDVGEYFIGIPSNIFESTCFIRQASVDDIHTSDVGNALENMLLSADENINLKKSLDKLDSGRRMLLHKNGKGGTLFDLQSEKENLESRLSKAKETSSEIILRSENISDMKNSLIKKRHELDRLDDICTAVDKVQAINRFEDLHKKEKNLYNVEKSFENYKESIKNNHGFIPDENYNATIKEILFSYSKSIKELKLAKNSLEEKQNDIKNAKEQFSMATDINADNIRAKGGVSVICKELRTNFKESDDKNKKAKYFIGASFSILALAILMAILGFVINSLFYLVFVASVMIIPSILLLTLGIKSRKVSKLLLQSVSNDIASYGVLTNPNNLSKNLVEKVEQNLLTCLKQEKITNELKEKELYAQERVDLRNSDYEGTLLRAQSAMEKWQISEKSLLKSKNENPQYDTVEISLKAIILDVETILSVLTDWKEKIFEIKSNVNNLKALLNEYEEDDLRARVTPETLSIYKEYSYENISEKRKFARSSLRSLSERCTNLEKDFIRLKTESENPARITVLIEENEKKYKLEKLKYDAIILAQYALENAGTNLRNSITPLLKSKSEKYMSSLSNGKYDFIGINEDYGMITKDVSDIAHSVDLLSAGTKDLAYLSLRLALVDMIFKENYPFLAVDEALSQLDDTRAKKALEILSSYCDMGGQCILFTCHSREKKLIQDICNANTIDL